MGREDKPKGFGESYAKEDMEAEAEIWWDSLPDSDKFINVKKWKSTILSINNPNKFIMPGNFFSCFVIVNFFLSKFSEKSTFFFQM